MKGWCRARLLLVSKAQNPMEKRAVAYFRLGSHPSLSATLRCLFTIRMRALMCVFEPFVGLTAALEQSRLPASIRGSEST